MIRLYDMNNYFRVLMETDVLGQAPRSFMTSMFEISDAVICVWDGKAASQKRKDIFPGYKQGRTPPPQGIYDGFHLTQKTLEHTKAMQAIVPGFEADDVIATLAQRFAKQGQTVAVYSADYDFNQLRAFSDRIIVGCKQKPEVPNPKYTRLYKVCLGDPSDKIPGIKLFGAKAWQANDKERLLKAVEKWATTKTVADEDFKGLNLSQAIRSWIAANVETIAVYWEIVGFFDVPIDLINQHTTFGQPDFGKADAVLREFLQ